MKKLLLLLIVWTTSFTALKAQGIWTSRTPFPDSARGYGIGFSIGNYGYMGLGTQSGDVNSISFNDFWQFNPSTNSWTKKSNFPGVARICPATFVIGNYAYIVTGQRSDSLPPHFTNECWQYNSSNDKWTQRANFPGVARGYAVGFSIGGKGYVGTGSQYNQNYRKDFWAYDTATNTWSQITDFGGTARISACGFSASGKGYLCFGDDSITGTRNDIWEYDTATKLWTQKNNNPGPSQCATSGFVINNKIYVGAGTDNTNGKCYNEFWQYEPLLDSWISQATLPGLGLTACSTFAIKDTGYLGLGVDSVVMGHKELYKFYADTTITSMNELLAAKDDIVIFPNPFNTSCTISIPDNFYNSIPKFTLYDFNGVQEDIRISDFNHRYILYRNNLTPGPYMLEIKYNNKIFNEKLLITN
ncbi:MAG TPA: T9SS type A sorting domain-containing protein [Bacteroidia bacterium]|jgi:N-acetylneuraminic acid mutarotase|nr:T9SS type A sorting domain-containing protein [Bacteroidia bacterium]